MKITRKKYVSDVRRVVDAEHIMRFAAEWMMTFIVHTIMHPTA